MQKTMIAKCLAGAVCALSLASCATMSDLVGKSSYDPSSYGTKALLETVASEDSTASNAAAAAQELANRRLSPEEGQQLFNALKTQKKEKVRIAILQTISAKQLTYLCKPVAAYALKAPDDDTGVEAAVTAVSLTSDPDEALKMAAAFLLKGPYAAQRARAARLIATTFPGAAEKLFIQALKTETSASAATLMCEYLAQKGTPDSLPTLEAIANDVGKKYEADKWLGVKTDADSVRAAAVRGVERLGELL